MCICSRKKKRKYIKTDSSGSQEKRDDCFVETIELVNRHLIGARKFSWHINPISLLYSRSCFCKVVKKIFFFSRSLSFWNITISVDRFGYYYCTIETKELKKLFSLSCESERERKRFSKSKITKLCGSVEKQNMNITLLFQKFITNLIGRGWPRGFKAGNSN